MALREMGYETIIVNSNPETVSTDYDSSDKLFFEPLTLEDVLHICEQEKPDGVIVQFGGQTPLNLANALEAHGVPIIGTSPKAIDLAEDREHFSALLKELGLKQADAGTATNVEDAAAIAARIGYPVLLRPSFVLGGRGMIIVYEEKELRRYMNEAVEASEERPVLIDRFLENAVEIDVDVIADRERAVIGAIMQHVEPAGIHSGDSASMIPAMGISMKMHKEITRASKELARKLNVCGLMNIQFAVKDEQLYVIEVNPRASRTVPFVSKSIGRPLAKLAAQVMAGKTLAELGFTREITPEYYCVKEAVFPWGRFPGIDVVLGPEMKSTGEVMGIDPDPDIAFAKSQVSAFNPLPTEGKVFISVNDRDKDRVLHMARQLADMGFTLCATRGTMIHLLQHDIECERAYKVNEARRPNIVDHIKNGDIDFIINTPGSHDARADDIIIRSSAIAAKTSYCTNLASAQACVNAIEALKNKNLQVCTIQEYHAKTFNPAPPTAYLHHHESHSRTGRRKRLHRFALRGHGHGSGGSLLQHVHDRLSGSIDGSVLQRPDRHHDLSPHRQLRRQSGRRGIRQSAGQRFCGGGAGESPLQLAGHGIPGPVAGKQGVIGIEGVDTRKIAKHLRSAGAMRACLTTELTPEEDRGSGQKRPPPMAGCNIVDKIGSHPHDTGGSGRAGYGKNSAPCGIRHRRL